MFMAIELFKKNNTKFTNILLSKIRIYKSHAIVSIQQESKYFYCDLSAKA